MSTLNITEEELNELVKLKDQGKIAEAWNYLGSKGDAYGRGQCRTSFLS